MGDSDNNPNLRDAAARLAAAMRDLFNTTRDALANPHDAAAQKAFADVSFSYYYYFLCIFIYIYLLIFVFVVIFGRIIILLVFFKFSLSFGVNNWFFLH